MIRKALAFTLIILALLCSCRPQPAELDRGTVEEPIWSNLFDAYWKKMNTNYIFWLLDSPDDEWERIYDEYMPRFKALDGIIGESKESTDLAFSYFFEISKELSDLHYSLYINATDDYFFFSKYEYALMHAEGYTDDEILRAFRDGETLSISKNVSTTMDSILHDSFGISLDSGRPEFLSHEEPSQYLKECYVFSYPDYGNCYILGKTSDNILYLGLSDFLFSEFLYVLPDSEAREGAEKFLKLWKTAIEDYLSNSGEDIKGIVIDLRGNTGGYNSDIHLLWNCLFTENLHILDTRAKDGMNRLDYGPWVKYRVQGEAERDFDKPIALITDKGTVSNGEVTVLLFKALHDCYGFDVSTFGGTTAGGLGTAITDSDPNNISDNEDPYILNAGQFNLGYYIICTTQNRHARYRNGEIYEGQGIEPDVFVDMTGSSDTRLEAALNWIRR